MTHTYGWYTLEQLEELERASHGRRAGNVVSYDGRAIRDWHEAATKAAPSLLARVRELEATVREREAERDKAQCLLDSLEKLYTGLEANVRGLEADLRRARSRWARDHHYLVGKRDAAEARVKELEAERDALREAARKAVDLFDDARNPYEVGRGIPALRDALDAMKEAPCE